eukprot:2662331-Heterocapsa_arctica.AAC.1
MIAHEQNRLAAAARSDAETVRQQANVEHTRQQANAHDLASTMRHSADAETVKRLSSLSKEKDAE